ncbi:hypothetical protein K440DRAFT_183277 [Wilcoxina mikolae CBS 423.85]|nr:hypothetical protein K440DRAFT_183277 [Wilcoxina mikolae CBS 423.85]
MTDAFDARVRRDCSTDKKSLSISTVPRYIQYLVYTRQTHGMGQYVVRLGRQLTVRPLGEGRFPNCLQVALHSQKGYTNYLIHLVELVRTCWSTMRSRLAIVDYSDTKARLMRSLCAPLLDPPLGTKDSALFIRANIKTPTRGFVCSNAHPYTEWKPFPETSWPELY